MKQGELGSGVRERQLTWQDGASHRVAGLQEAPAEQLQSWDVLVTVSEGLVLGERTSGGSPPNSDSWWPGGVGDSAGPWGECVIRI